MVVSSSGGFDFFTFDSKYQLFSLEFTFYKNVLSFFPDLFKIFVGFMFAFIFSTIIIVMYKLRRLDHRREQTDAEV